MQLLIDLPDEMVRLLDEAGGGADRGLLLEVAGSLVARGLLSSGRAARLLGMERLDFLEEMARRKLSIVGTEHWAQEGV
jgi:predicted HTH domain antitoxin